MKFDLHCHSHFSDGALTPTELIALAVERGVTHLALTDHDTLAGLPELRAASEQSAVQIINGVELSCEWRHQLLHVLGLNVDPDNDLLRAGIRRNTEQRFARAEAMYREFERQDINLRAEVAAQLPPDSVPTRPHFAQALVNLGVVKNKNKAFKKFLVRGKPGFVPMVWPDIAEVSEWIQAAGGVAVLAHPLRYKFTRSKLVRLIKDMLAVGIEGMEVSTGNTDTQQCEMLAILAQRHGLLASMGSDFHTPNQPWAALGTAAPLAQSLTPVWSRF
ncbi:MAG: PHP domain-containing protein [Gammaproteobacteria bacterium]|nr:PHP domain-containing protein [Gammaproteobacteria bacterium]